jgi:FixJ family two-component response regulator
MPIIFVTGHSDIPMMVKAMKAGAVEFLTKPFKGDVLSQSVRNAVEMSSALLGREEEIQTLKERYADLTSREGDVMALVVIGLLNKQVGSRLGISEVTMKKDRGNAMRKMKAESLAELVKVAVRLRLLQAYPYD